MLCRWGSRRRRLLDEVVLLADPVVVAAVVAWVGRRVDRDGRASEDDDAACDRRPVRTHGTARSHVQLAADFDVDGMARRLGDRVGAEAHVAERVDRDVQDDVVRAREVELARSGDEGGRDEDVIPDRAPLRRFRAG